MNKIRNTWNNLIAREEKGEIIIGKEWKHYAAFEEDYLDVEGAVTIVTQHTGAVPIYNRNYVRFLTLCQYRTLAHMAHCEEYHIDIRNGSFPVITYSPEGEEMTLTSFNQQCEAEAIQMHIHAKHLVDYMDNSDYIDDYNAMPRITLETNYMEYPEKFVLWEKPYLIAPCSGRVMIDSMYSGSHPCLTNVMTHKIQVGTSPIQLTTADMLGFLSNTKGTYDIIHTDTNVVRDILL